VVLRAGGQAGLARLVDLLVLGPGHDVQVAAAVAAGVPADQARVRELLEVVLDVDGGVLGAQGPEQPGDDRGVVAVAAVVVRLAEQPEEGPLGLDAHFGERLGDERLRLDGSDPRHVSGPDRRRSGRCG
jgi:hypothetical protein